MTTVDYERAPTVAEAGPHSELAAKLQRMWETAPGLRGFFTTVDHKEIGIRYMITAFVFLALGGLEAVVMRLQLAGPNEHLDRKSTRLNSSHMSISYAVFC